MEESTGVISLWIKIRQAIAANSIASCNTTICLAPLSVNIFEQKHVRFLPNERARAVRPWVPLMTMKQRVRLWLREIGGSYCDACLAEELNLSQRQANKIAVALSLTDEFYRRRGFCRLCDKERKVTGTT